jgi:hypothetical protein
MAKGCVYIVGSNDYRRVKVGYWKGTLYKLRARYVTCYGNDLYLETFPTEYPEILEKVFKFKFTDYCVCCELYKLEHKELYKEFLSNYCSKSLPELEGELKLRINKKEVREAFQSYLRELSLDYIVTEDYEITNHKSANYEILSKYDSDFLKSVLEKVQSMALDNIKSKFRKAIIPTLSAFIIIRRYLEITGNVSSFQTTQTIIKSEKQKELVEKIVEEDKEMYYSAFKYLTETKLRIDQIQGNNSIQKIIFKVLKRQSYERKGSHKKGWYSHYVIKIEA